MLTPAQFLEHYHVIRQTFAPLRLTRWQLTKLVTAQLWRDVTPLARVLIVAVCLLLPIWLASQSLGPKSLRKLGIPLASKSKSRKLDFKEVLEGSAAKVLPFIPILYRRSVHLTGPEPKLPVPAQRLRRRLRCLPIAVLRRDQEASGKQSIGSGLLPRDIPRALVRRAAADTRTLEVRLSFTLPLHPAHTRPLRRTIAVDLSRAIPSLVRQRQHDCAAACDAVIGPCPDWTEVTLYGAMQDLVASTNASAFVGRALGTDRHWVRAVDRLPMAVAIATVLTGYTPLLLRPLVKPLVFAPAMWIRWGMARMLGPIIDEDMRECEGAADKKDLLGPRDKGKVPLTAWLMARYKGGATLERLIQDYITVSFESTPSSAGTLFFVMGELAADPALADVLRRELGEEVEEGRLPRSHLNELRMMDSVMRESARVNGFSHRKCSELVFFFFS